MGGAIVSVSAPADPPDVERRRPFTDGAILFASAPAVLPSGSTPTDEQEAP